MKKVSARGQRRGIKIARTLELREMLNFVSTLVLILVAWLLVVFLVPNKQD